MPSAPLFIFIFYNYTHTITNRQLCVFVIVCVCVCMFLEPPLWKAYSTFQHERTTMLYGGYYIVCCWPLLPLYMLMCWNILYQREESKVCHFVFFNVFLFLFFFPLARTLILFHWKKGTSLRKLPKLTSRTS